MNRILILATPRTGSNLLIDSLAQHPCAITGGEILSPNAYQNSDEAVANIEAGRDINLAKVFWSQRHHVRFTELVDTFPVKVHLKRLDRPAQLRSWRLACESGDWVYCQTRPDVAAFPDDASDQLMSANIFFSGIATITLTYEDLLAYWDQSIASCLRHATWPLMRLGQTRTRQS